jgi:death on curing protein
MNFRQLSAELVDVIHDEVLNPGELPGRALDKSLEGALARVERLHAYGLHHDIFDLAGSYAMVIACGDYFNNGNKRTAHQVMDACLDLNGIEILWNHLEIGPLIIRLAQGLIDDGDLAEWLRIRV